MPTEIHGTMRRMPTVKFTRKGQEDVPNTWVIGRLLAARELGPNKGHIFELAIENAHDKLAIQTATGKDANGKNTYAEVEVKPNDVVSIFGGVSEKGVANQLEDKLSQVPAGTRIKVVYNGKKLNPSSGREYNDYSVLMLEENEEASNGTGN